MDFVATMLQRLRVLSIRDLFLPQFPFVARDGVLPSCRRGRNREKRKEKRQGANEEREDEERAGEREEEEEEAHRTAIVYSRGRGKNRNYDLGDHERVTARCRRESRNLSRDYNAGTGTYAPYALITVFTESDPGVIFASFRNVHDSSRDASRG